MATNTLFYIRIEITSGGQGCGYHYMISDNTNKLDIFRLELLKYKNYIKLVAEERLDCYEFIEQIYIMIDTKWYRIIDNNYIPRNFNKLKKINWDNENKRAHKTLHYEDLQIIDDYRLNYVYNTYGYKDILLIDNFNILLHI